MTVAELKTLLNACPDDALVLVTDGYGQGASFGGIDIRKADDALIEETSFSPEVRARISEATTVVILGQDGTDMEF